MSPADPPSLYRAAQRSGRRMSGYYHNNVRVGPVLVRIPVPGAEQMDLRGWPEPDVLCAVTPHVDGVPRLLHSCGDPPFQIHEFVSGQQLNELAPRGTRVPPQVIPAVLRLFDQLATVPFDELPPLPVGWPDDSRDFARMLSDVTQQVFDDHRGELFRALGIPDDPLATVVAAWPAMTTRPFRVVHADVHRKNMIRSSGGVFFLDWELALWGDPVYDLAVHIHKMAYRDDELHALLAGWAAQSPDAWSWRDDLAGYLRHEQVKSAIVHTLRYTREILTEGTSVARRDILTSKLAGDLNTARRIWGLPPNLTALNVARVITEWTDDEDR
ncbi:MAG TPA: aminoglycoside phosphotransferase family protein [Pseudonocardiaceae bacterium]